MLNVSLAVEVWPQVANLRQSGDNKTLTADAQAHLKRMEETITTIDNTNKKGSLNYILVQQKITDSGGVGKLIIKKFD